MGMRRSRATPDLWLRATRGLPRGRPRRMAGLIAAVGLGLGLVLRKAELDRRATRQRRARERKFTPRRGERLSDGLHRMALGQLDLAIDCLQVDHSNATGLEIHETRKAIKRLRALLRLSRPQLAEGVFERENQVLRRAAKQLAQARDAEVMAATLDLMIQRHPKKLGASPAIGRLNRRLRAESQVGASANRLAEDARRSALAELCKSRQRVHAWQLTDGDFELVADGLEDIYRRGRKALGKARNHKDSSLLHDWRKRVKDLRYAAQMLTRKDARRQSDLDRVRAVARRADRLAELLGQEHDLATLSQRIREHRDLFKGEKRTRKALQQLIKKRRKRLRHKALKLGRKLYSESPDNFVRSIGRAQQRAGRDCGHAHEHR